MISRGMVVTHPWAVTFWKVGLTLDSKSSPSHICHCYPCLLPPKPWGYASPRKTLNVANVFQQGALPAHSSQQGPMDFPVPKERAGASSLWSIGHHWAQHLCLGIDREGSAKGLLGPVGAGWGDKNEPWGCRESALSSPWQPRPCYQLLGHLARTQLLWKCADPGCLQGPCGGTQTIGVAAKRCFVYRQHLWHPGWVGGPDRPIGEPRISRDGSETCSVPPPHTISLYATTFHRKPVASLLAVWCVEIPGKFTSEKEQSQSPISLMETANFLQLLSLIFFWSEKFTLCPKEMILIWTLPPKTSAQCPALFPTPHKPRTHRASLGPHPTPNLWLSQHGLGGSKGRDRWASCCHATFSHQWLIFAFCKNHHEILTMRPLLSDFHGQRLWMMETDFEKLKQFKLVILQYQLLNRAEIGKPRYPRGTRGWQLSYTLVEGPRGKRPAVSDTDVQDQDRRCDHQRSCKSDSWEKQ